MRAALLPGGAVVFDESGQISFGLSDEALTELVGEAPDFLRVAVAHLAAERAVADGLVDVEVTAEGDVGIRRGLAAPRGAPDENPPAVVIRSAGFLAQDLLDAALHARGDGLAALPIVAPGGRSYIGPILAPDEGPCILCLRHAVAPNRTSERLLGPEAGEPRGLWLTDSEALGLVREASSSPSDEILELDPGGRIVRLHHVRSNPQCAVCGGDPVDPNGECPVLESRHKHTAADTGSRMRDPQDTYEAYKHLISPLSGAVRRVRVVDMDAPDLIHVFTASHAMSEPARSYAAVMRDGRDHSGGKGSTAEQARVSALCEALERFSAISTPRDVDIVAPLADVDGALHPSDCMLFSERQYENRQEWNRDRSRFQYVPQRFDESQRVAWSRVWNLQTGDHGYLPTAMLYFGFPGPGSAFCRADSNGLAAGETFEEAVLQAFLELVERDAIAIWWYNRLRMPEVDVTTLDDTYVDEVFDHYRRLGRRAWVLDLTSDLGIPVFAALSAREGRGRPEVIFGFGAHLDPSVALRRSVTEMNQMLATIIRPVEHRRRHLRGTFDDALRWWEEATLDDNPYLVPGLDLARRGRKCFERVLNDDLRDDVEACLNVARRHGLAVYVRDMTRADLGISVAKVVVPGLRHFWRRLAPGRLYHAPVAMGRVPAPGREEDMNPTSFFV